MWLLPPAAVAHFSVSSLPDDAEFAVVCEQTSVSLRTAELPEL
jgi:hypothetical protein